MSTRGSKARERPARSVSATEAKNTFAELLDAAVTSGPVVITKHDKPRAVLLAYDEFLAISAPRERPLETLSAEFDTMLERMQAPGAAAKMRAAFGASPAALGKAAVAAARTKR
jgi:prevent-host-death family protein